MLLENIFWQSSRLSYAEGRRLSISPVSLIHFGLMCVPVVAGTHLRFNYPRDASSLWYIYVRFSYPIDSLLVTCEIG